MTTWIIRPKDDSDEKHFLSAVTTEEVSMLGKNIITEQSPARSLPPRVSKFKKWKMMFGAKVAELRRIAGNEIPAAAGIAWSTILLGALLVTLQVLFVTILLAVMA